MTFTDFFIWAGGVSEEAKYAKEKGQETMLKLFGFFICAAFLLAFSCLYLPLSVNTGSWTGGVAGLTWAVVVTLMDRLLFASGNLSSILLRVLILVSTSLVTSFMLGLGLEDAKIKTTIEQNNVETKNSHIENNVAALNRVLSCIKVITEVEIQLARNKDLTPTIAGILERDKDFSKKAMKSSLEEISKNKLVLKPDYSFGNKLSTYWNLPSDEKFGGAYWFVFIIELLPLITRFVYYFIYGNK